MVMMIDIMMIRMMLMLEKIQLVLRMETIHSNGLIYRWLPLMVMVMIKMMLMIIKIHLFLIHSISIVVFKMTDLIDIVMGESCTFGIC